MNKILQEDFDLAPCMVAGYESFMDGLLNIVHSGPICESVGERIKSYVLDFVQNHPLDSFDCFSSGVVDLPVDEFFLAGGVE